MLEIIIMVSLVNFMCQNLNIVFEINITTENNSCQVYLTFLFFCLDTKETKSQGCFIFLTPKLHKISKHKKLAFVTQTPI